jgi:hypothetical protein
VRCLFVGIDGFAGFRYGCVYDVTYSELPDGKLRLALDHAPVLQQDVSQLAIRRALFEKWWLPLLS